MTGWGTTPRLQEHDQDKHIGAGWKEAVRCRCMKRRSLANRQKAELHLIADQGPELVQVDDGLEVLVLPDVEVPHAHLQPGDTFLGCELSEVGNMLCLQSNISHQGNGTHLPEVPRMVLVHHDSVVVLATRISTAARMLPVLADAPMPRTNVPPLLPVLPQSCKQQSAGCQALLSTVQRHRHAGSLKSLHLQLHLLHNSNLWLAQL